MAAVNHKNINDHSFTALLASFKFKVEDQHPSAIMRAAFILLSCVVAVALCQEESYPPQPFEFSYSAEDPEGSHSHTQQGDGTGKVTGEYTIQLADGRMRTVKYVADENGYRAEIITNELGTESKNPADVTIESSAPTGAEAALQGSSSKAAASYAAPVYVPYAYANHY